MRTFGRVFDASRAKIGQIGLIPFARLVLQKIVDRCRRRRCACADVYRPHLAGAHGLEIGGPSPIFAATGQVPVYDAAARIDGLNFATETLWGDGLGDDRPYVCGKTALGRQYVREATDFPDIASASYDFVLSSHVIEHLANPLAGLREWKRVLREEGMLILVVPHRDGTFDRKRPVTTLDHLREDFRTEVGEDDRTHIAEVLELHDFRLDFWSSDRQEFVDRCHDNFRYRGVHHHVFDTELAVRVADQAGFRILAVDHAMPNSIVIIARKAGNGPVPDNAGSTGDGAAWRRTSPFPSDRRPANGT